MMPGFSIKTKQKLVLGLLTTAALMKINANFSERVEVFFQSNPDDTYPAAQLAQWSLIGFLFAVYVLLIALIGLLALVLLHVVYNNSPKDVASLAQGQGQGMPPGMPPVKGAQQMPQGMPVIKEGVQQMQMPQGVNNPGPGSMQVPPGQSGILDGDEGYNSILGFFFNSFFLYWVALSTCYGLLHFCIFCFYINSISMQVNCLDNPIYVKALVFWYTVTYGLGALAILLIM